MKYRYLLVFPLLIVAGAASWIAAAGIAAPSKGYIISSCRADLDNDGVVEELLLEGESKSGYADFLSVRSGGQEISRSLLKELKPWKVQAADVDGDGKPEISVGVFKTARFDPVPDKRPFIYNWNQNGLSPKWLGSRLSRPFDDYIFSDVDGDGMDELISIEHLADGKKVINSYKWKGFGFEGLGESRSFRDIRELKADTAAGPELPVLTAEILEGDRWEQIALKYEDGELK